MNIGYARVSTDDQTTALQRDALSAAGCELIHEDQGVSGVSNRPALAEAINSLQPGDVLTVWRLDRLGRSLPDLIALVKAIEAKGAGFRSLTESIDTTTASGTLLFHVMGALAQFERALMLERTRAGMAAAKRRGVTAGRKRSLSGRQIEHARQLVAAGEGHQAVAASLGVSYDTLRRAFKREEERERLEQAA
jgi:DNA invertase Pin-like site-specific DNA recombinase